MASNPPRARGPTRFQVGDRVLILKSHPHQGKLGRVVGMEVLALIAHLGPRPRVELDSGEQCFLTSDSDARRVD